MNNIGTIDFCIWLDFKFTWKLFITNAETAVTVISTLNVYQLSYLDPKSRIDAAGAYSIDLIFASISFLQLNQSDAKTKRSKEGTNLTLSLFGHKFERT